MEQGLVPDDPLEARDRFVAKGIKMLRSYPLYYLLNFAFKSIFIGFYVYLAFIVKDRESCAYVEDPEDA